ncbi:MAG: hypothetical protein NC340_01625 [Ruminococcus flavefaciens]|nr:hypothetical protein [Ruminococcus flavefaciens]MCM1228846.1 hypothetical protein [Ruminococcus flavefaciens]
MDKELLAKINRFTRREFSEEEIYTFSVILCDNEIDRDGERFSDNALEKLKTLFVGKTGIFDHNTSTANQSARIFDTEIITDTGRTTQNGEPYKYLKAMAYMVRNDNSRNLISEIEGGIKKEVSISCSATKKVCSVCGSNKSTSNCSHIKGKKYGDRICHIILDDIADAYEWSFVAVPAQVNAGVTKKFTEEATEKSADIDTAEINRELRRDIRRLAFFRGGRTAVETVEISARTMNTTQLMGLKKAYERITGRNTAEVQLMPDSKKEQLQASAYKI